MYPFPLIFAHGLASPEYNKNEKGLESLTCLRRNAEDWRYDSSYLRTEDLHLLH